MSILPLYVYFIAISLLASLSVYFTSKESPFYLKLFPPFLLATLIVESLGAYLPSVGKPNVWLYNFFTISEFCFYLFVLRLIINSSNIKKVIWIILILYPIIAV